MWRHFYNKKKVCKSKVSKIVLTNQIKERILDRTFVFADFNLDGSAKFGLQQPPAPKVAPFGGSPRSSLVRRSLTSPEVASGACSKKQVQDYYLGIKSQVLDRFDDSTVLSSKGFGANDCIPEPHIAVNTCTQTGKEPMRNLQKQQQMPNYRHDFQ